MPRTIEPGGMMPEPPPVPDSRPARSEAVEAAILWALALVATVGLSTWLGGSDVRPILGVPRWAVYGIFAPWLLFFFLHLRFCRPRPPKTPPS